MTRAAINMIYTKSILLILTGKYLVFFVGFPMHLVSAAFEISSAILDETISKGTITYSI